MSRIVHVRALKTLTDGQTIDDIFMSPKLVARRTKTNIVFKIIFNFPLRIKRALVIRNDTKQD